MKNYLVILISFLSLTVSFAQDRIPGDPIPGLDVKVGKKPPGGNPFAQGTTGADGSYQFKNLPAGKGYFITVGFSIRENGIKSASQTIEINDIEITKSGETTYRNKVVGDPHVDQKDGTRWDKKSLTNNPISVTVTAAKGTIKVKVIKNK